MVNEFPYSFHTSKRQRGHSVAHERPEGLLEARTSGGRAATIALVIRQTRVRILANITLFHIRNDRKETTPIFEGIIGSRGRLRRIRRVRVGLQECPEEAHIRPGTREATTLGKRSNPRRIWRSLWSLRNDWRHRDRKLILWTSYWRRTIREVTGPRMGEQTSPRGTRSNHWSSSWRLRRRGRAEPVGGIPLRHWR